MVGLDPGLLSRGLRRRGRNCHLAALVAAVQLLHDSRRLAKLSSNWRASLGARDIGAPIIVAQERRREPLWAQDFCGGSGQSWRADNGESRARIELVL